MPNSEKINNYIISHGVKDQLLAMFDQTLSNQKMVDNDPWHLKSIYDLTYLIRKTATEAINEQAAVKLTPFETKLRVDNEIIKLYWHFFTNQKNYYSDLKNRYKGIERLKTVAHIIKNANACIMNPKNISFDLQWVGIEEWGESFIKIKESEKKIDSLSRQIAKLDDFRSAFNDAVLKTKTFRQSQATIVDKYKVLSKSLKDIDIADVNTSQTQLELKNLKQVQIKQFIEDTFSQSSKLRLQDKLTSLSNNIVEGIDDMSQLENLAIEAHRQTSNIQSPKQLFNSLQSKKIFSKLEKKMTHLNELIDKQVDAIKTSVSEDQEIVLNLDKINANIKKRLVADPKNLSGLENKLLNFIKEKLGKPLHQLDDETYCNMEPYILSDLNYIETLTPTEQSYYTADNVNAYDLKTKMFSALNAYFEGNDINLDLEDKDPRLVNMIKFSQGRKVTLSSFEYEIVNLVEKKLGYKLAFMEKDEFEILEPFILKAIETKDIRNMDEIYFDVKAFDDTADENKFEKNIDIDFVHPELKGLLQASLDGLSDLNQNESVISSREQFQNKLLNQLESTIGFRLIDMCVEDFNQFEPVLIKAIRKQNLTDIDSFIASKYVKEIADNYDTNISPDMSKDILWPSKIKSDASSGALANILTIFDGVKRFKTGEYTSYNSFKSLFKEPQMEHFYSALAMKMCSYTTTLLNHRPDLGEEINLEEVNPEFKEKTMDLVFKFASFARYLRCNELTAAEIESLQVQVEKTINLIYNKLPNQYGPIAKWTLTRYQKMTGQDVDGLDLNQLMLFSNIYGMDFEDSQSQILNLIQSPQTDLSKENNQLLENANIEIFRNKFDKIGGFASLNRKELHEVVTLYNKANKTDKINKLTAWVDNKFVEYLSNTYTDLNTSFDKNQLGTYYHAAQKLNATSKALIYKYSKLKNDVSHGKKLFVQQPGIPKELDDKAFYDFIYFNEKVFRSSIYTWPQSRLTQINSFINDKTIDYDQWQSWLDKTLKDVPKNKASIDIKVLYNIISSKKAGDDAITETLSWLEKSQKVHLKDNFLPALSLIEKKHNESKITYKQAREIINNFENVSSLSKPSSVFISKYRPVVEIEDTQIEELTKEVLLLMDELKAYDALPSDLKVIDLLKEKDFAKIQDQNLLTSTKATLSDLIKKNPSGMDLLYAENKLKSLGYQTDFTEETMADLPAYQVFFKALNPAIKKTKTLDFLATKHAKHFSPKAIKDAIISQKKDLEIALADTNHFIEKSTEKNKLAKEFSDELLLINTAFAAVEKNKGIEDIESLEQIKVSGYTPEKDLPLMMKFMSSLKKVDIMDESNLIDNIRVLRLIEKIKTFDDKIAKKLLNNMDSDTKAYLKAVSEKIKHRYADLKGINHDTDNSQYQMTIIDLVRSIRLLQSNQYLDEQSFIGVAKNAMFAFPLSDILNKMDAKQIAIFVKSFDENSQSKSKVLQALDTDKYLSVSSLLGQENQFLEVDINDSNKDDELSEKAMYFLSQNYTDLYHNLLRQYLFDPNVNNLLGTLENEYVSYLGEKAINTQEKTILDLVSTFVLRGNTDMFFQYMTFLLPKNTDRAFLDQMIAQFAPVWSREIKLDQSKLATDASLSALLLNHHGAAKLLNNNVEYHMSSQVANLSLIISFTMFVLSFFLWATPVIYIFGVTLFSSIFMKICIEHNKAMALKPYAISDQQGLMSSLNQIGSIWEKYDNSEAQLVLRMIEDLHFLKDFEPLRSYSIQYFSRMKHIDLVKLSELEAASNIATVANQPVATRLEQLFDKQTTLIDQKILIKELDSKSNIVFSDNQYEQAIKLKQFANTELKAQLPSEFDSQGIKKLLVSFYGIEYPTLSLAKIESLYGFIFMDKSDKDNLNLDNPMRDLADKDAAKLLSAIHGIKKIKAQIEDYSTSGEYFPSYQDLRKIPDIKEVDVAYMEAKKVKTFKALKALVDSSDYRGTTLTSLDYNDSVKSIIEDYLKSSGDNLRMACKIKPMSLFGAIKVEDKKSEEDEDQSSLSIDVVGS
ncbi:MAG: hypothetical protein VX835_05665 [Pseudomonadota bacterium]|nr:hypothetical protein [Pseudomonadota bacterium]